MQLLQETASPSRARAASVGLHAPTSPKHTARQADCGHTPRKVFHDPKERIPTVHLCHLLTGHDVCILNLYSKDRQVIVHQYFGVVVSSPNCEAGVRGSSLQRDKVHFGILDRRQNRSV